MEVSIATVIELGVVPSNGQSGSFELFLPKASSRLSESGNRSVKRRLYCTTSSGSGSNKSIQPNQLRILGSVRRASAPQCLDLFAAGHFQPHWVSETPCIECEQFSWTKHLHKIEASNVAMSNITPVPGKFPSLSHMQ